MKVSTPIPGAPAANPSVVSTAGWMVLLAAFLGWMFDGMEMGIFPLVARPALAELQQNISGVVDDQFIGLWIGRINALFLLGAAAGGLVFGWLGDKVGRVRAMSLSILTYSLFTGFSYFATAPWHLGLYRFIGALGMGGEWSLGVALVMEVWPEKHRPILAGAIGAASNVGFALIPMLAIFFPVTRESWRWVMLVGIAPAFLVFFILKVVPESERWKASVREKKSNPISEVFSQPLLKRTLLAIAYSSIALIVTWGAVQWVASWADKLAGPSMPRAKAYTQTLAAWGAVVGCFGGALAGNLIGRRPTYFLLCLVSLGIGSYMFRFVDHYGGEFLVFSFLLGAVTASFYGWLPLYLPELFPTRVRATAQGLSYNFGRILAAVGALKAGSWMDKFHWSYAQAGASIVLVYLAGLVLIWFAPETKGKPLPD